MYFLIAYFIHEDFDACSLALFEKENQRLKDSDVQSLLKR